MTRDLTQIAHQTQKALVKATSNVININLIIDPSRKNCFQKPEI